MILIANDPPPFHLPAEDTLVWCSNLLYAYAGLFNCVHGSYAGAKDDQLIMKNVLAILSLVVGLMIPQSIPWEGKYCPSLCKWFS